MKTRTKYFHAAAILASSLINMHVFVSVAAHASVFYTIAFGLSLWYVSRFAEVKIGAIKEIFGEPEDSPDTKAIPWIKSIPDQPVTINQVHAGNFWDHYPWANFVTQDSDGDIYVWKKEPKHGKEFDIPQWVVSFEDSAGLYDCFKRAPANYREPNWTDHIAKRGEMPEWLKNSIQKTNQP